MLGLTPGRFLLYLAIAVGWALLCYWVITDWHGFVQTFNPNTW